MKEVEILAKTIYGEARGESVSGKEAIASVVLNRVNFARSKGGYWWGSTPQEVCLKLWQFSCWNKDDPNFVKLQRLDDSDDVYCTCKRIAYRAFAGLVEDKTNYATHYHTKNIRPKWAFGKIPSATIGNHFFYNNIEG
ncbi:MAG: cell wall hydrolase [Lactobacillus sp.]|jgi:hypothetical protein|nr:cell wall hydrolase [Lactobacillus sp.]